MTRSKKNTTGKPTTATQLSPMMTVAEHSFQIGYSSAMQTFAEAAAAFEAKSHDVIVKQKPYLPAPTGKTAIETGI